MSTRKAAASSEIAGSLAAELRTVHRALKARVREHGGSKDLSPSQISVLVRLERDGATTMSSLARAEGMRPQSMTEVTAPLLESGLLRRSPDPDDGRQTLISLTPKCVKWIQKGRAASHDWLTTTISQKLSIEEQETLLDSLGLLRRLVEE
jgi:DNA-binding MarR family transcriptional regulator